MDFTGALYVRNGNGEEKAYICLFTCANTRAIHLEVVSDMTEESFLQASCRFVSRRSLPVIMISDNASTYLAAASDIAQLMKSTAVQNALRNRGTTWQFIPKRAPWYGGFWECLIGLTKMTLKKVLGRTFISLTGLQTVVTEIEAVLNDWPITYVSSDMLVTPSHSLRHTSCMYAGLIHCHTSQGKKLMLQTLVKILELFFALDLLNKPNCYSTFNVVGNGNI